MLRLAQSNTPLQPLLQVLVVIAVIVVSVALWVLVFSLTRRVILHFRPDSRYRFGSRPSRHWPNRPRDDAAPPGDGGPS